MERRFRRCGGASLHRNGRNAAVERRLSDGLESRVRVLAGGGNGGTAEPCLTRRAGWTAEFFRFGSTRTAAGFDRIRLTRLRNRWLGQLGQVLIDMGATGMIKSQIKQF